MTIVELTRPGASRFFAQGRFDSPHTCQWDWICTTLEREHGCAEDDIRCVETDDGDAVAVRGEIVAYISQR